MEIARISDDSRVQKIGKVDFLLGKVEDGRVTDFAALEVQAAYFSGGNLRSVLAHYMQTHTLDGIDSNRRPDFRSCAQKRLMPQLQLKMPVFRRWGKKFFVVVDSAFFQSLPGFRTTTKSNSEITWLAYPFKNAGTSYVLGTPNIVFSEWDEVQNSLREGVPPEPAQILMELQTKLQIGGAREGFILQC